jgi:hypothetical protein
MHDEDDDQAWEAAGRRALAALTSDDVPSLEVLLLDALAHWVLSEDNPGTSYNEQAGGAVISMLLNSVEKAPQWQPQEQPPGTPELTRMRESVAAGAAELSAEPNGLALMISRLMPAAIGELERNTGSAGAQIYWTFMYSLMVLASGVDGDLDEDTGRAVVASFDAWDQLMQQGFRLPWREAT